MKLKVFLYGVLVLLILTSVWLFYDSAGAKITEYTFVDITKGNVEEIVSATGTLSPVTEVEVGTQLSGTIDSVYVDFNDVVKDGQILAILDTTLLKASVIDAQATLERNKALMSLAESDFAKNKSLFERNMISESDFLQYEVNLKTQAATIKSSEASLLRAEKNLEYAVIRSPESGIVISRNVESGQTVAASLSTPTLFVIAKDLSEMEIMAEVDESDIGQIKFGQNVRFEVSAFSNREFEGVVNQIRLQPSTISNIVTYIVVIDAINDDGALLPGMTATVDFITESRSDVLLVPNKALRFQPDDEKIQEFFEKQRVLHSVNPREHDRKITSDTTSGKRENSPRESDTNIATVWLMDSSNQLSIERLHTGLSDGINTEILTSKSLEEGTTIISGFLNSSSETNKTKTTNMRGMGGGPPRGPL